MIKNCFLIFWAVLFLASCSGNKAGSQAVDNSSDSADSSLEVPDSMDKAITAAPMPKSADELFDDFFFNFAANRKLQFKRIVFPLVVINGKDSVSLNRNQWKMEHFFMKQDFYTVIFDNEKQMELVKDTAICHVTVEKINLKRNHVKQYFFSRLNGLWMLTKVNIQGVYQSTNSSFLKFYERFATDTAFQVRSLNNPVRFVGPDPDDDFSTMEGIITPDTWFGFAPELPSGIIYNVIYGQQYKESNQKIFVKRGIANGLEIELIFKKVKGKWLLIKLET